MASSYRVLLIALLAGVAARVESQSVVALTADTVRGGWVADVGGVRHLFVLKVRDGMVSGIYCDVDCRDPAHLAFIDNGRLGPGGLQFQILRGDVRSRTHVVGRLDGEHLMLTFATRGDRAREPKQLSLQRDPRKPAPRTVEELFARRGVTSGSLVISGSATPYVPPAPNELITPAALEGLWVWNTGPDKQHFIFRQIGGRMLGVACGPCDNPHSFGPLDNFVLKGDTATFDINHEDAGIGIEFGPFANHATVTLAHHEMHLRTISQHGSRTVEGDLVLAGPLRTSVR
jgi:hypothetical protein